MLLRRAFTLNILFASKNQSIFLIRKNSSTIEQLRIKRFRKMEKDIKTRENPIVTKLNTPEFKSLFTPELETLIKLFEKYDYELRIAGGAVRDILMNIHPKDVDFATNATPNNMKEMFTKEDVRLINMRGEKHGTITPRINDKENFEITTLRIDVLTNGRHAEVQFTTDWQVDANRRDLTINSMFLGFDGSVYDFFFGYEDLMKRRVVFVGNADIRIKEDFLRILRYFRFYGRIAKYPNNHDEKTIKAITENVSGLQIISGERIWSEIKKTLEGNYAYNLIIKMLECGIGEYIGLPKIVNLKELDRVFKHSSLFEKSCYPITFITALLANTDDAIKLHERLKLSAFERDLALFITQNRDKLQDINEIIYFKKLAMLPYAKKEFIDEILKYLGKYDIYLEFIKWRIPTLQINGNMLKERGCPPGKIMGNVMSEIKIIWADDNFETSVDDLLNIHLPKILANCDLKNSNKKLKVSK